MSDGDLTQRLALVEIMLSNVVEALTLLQTQVRLGSSGDPTALLESLWTVQQAAQFLKIQPGTVYRLHAAGKLPSVKVGGSVRFVPAAVRDYLERDKE